MDKKNFKEFVKDHKKAIVIGCVGVAAIVAAAFGLKPVSKSGVFVPDHEDIKAEEVLNVLCGLASDAGKVSKGATMYSLWKAAEDVPMFTDNIFTDADGDTIKITGALLFGNPVDK